MAAAEGLLEVTGPPNGPWMPRRWSGSAAVLTDLMHVPSPCTLGRLLADPEHGAGGPSPTGPLELAEGSAGSTVRGDRPAPRPQVLAVGFSTAGPEGRAGAGADGTHQDAA